MIRNSWNNIELICGAHGADYTNQMHLQEGPHSLFYACPQYKSIYGTHHEGRSCNNRLTLADYEKLLSFLSDAAEGCDGLVETDITGLEWKHNGVFYKVLEHKEGKYKVLMRNDKAMAK